MPFLRHLTGFTNTSFVFQPNNLSKNALLITHLMKCLCYGVFVKLWVIFGCLGVNSFSQRICKIWKYGMK